MDFLSLIKKRRSVRDYQDKPIEEGKLKRVLNAARLAPSARNSQKWKFIVVKDKEKKEKLAQIAKGQTFISEASVVVVGVGLEADRTITCDVPTYAVDLAIAMDHVTLAAVNEDLGTCWIGAFDQKKAKELLNVPESAKITALMPLGYPADSPKPKQRKDLEEIISYNEFK